MIYLILALALVALVVQEMIHHRERRENDKAMRLLMSRIEGRPVRDVERKDPTPAPPPISANNDEAFVALKKGLNGERI